MAGCVHESEAASNNDDEWRQVLGVRSPIASLVRGAFGVAALIIRYQQRIYDDASSPQHWHC